jgi:tol-pal system-associated acyl-CoA thioesterase
MIENKHTVKVYLEDTDAFGLVYHSNYLKYCERTRTDLLEQCGFTIGEMLHQGMRFVVMEMTLKFLKPARLHDVLEVRTTAKRVSDYRVNFDHKVFVVSDDAKPIFSATAKVVTIDAEGQLTPLPDDLLAEDMLE